MEIENGTANGKEIELKNTHYALVPAESNAGNHTEKKSAVDLTWVNLNFKVNDKDILSKCWGKVFRKYSLLPFSFFVTVTV